ncbi:MAG: lipopolysaccharide biosynthesis protein [Candidatus Methanoplasma sp.]|jgi:membrane protein EpsK|nr:lipopolysaccharide biosynthesis protein [Candidatus Methanoplasma sp.]
MAAELTDTEHREFSKRLAPNMVTNVIRTVLTAMIGLLLVPYYIGELGSAVYAILPLATSVTSYVLVVSDEITNAFSRYLVISIHRNDREEANRVYTTTIIGLGKTVFAIAPIVAIVSFVSPYVFQIGPSSAASVQTMFIMILSSALMISFSACFNSIYTAFNKMYVLYAVRSIYIILQVVLIICFFVVAGPSLEMIGLAYVISGAVFFVMVRVSSRRLCPTLRIDRRLYDRKLLKEMGSVGIWTVLSRIGLLMLIQASLIMVNLFLGTEEQTGFSIVATMISMTNTACITITTVIAPFLYRSYADGNRENLVKISKTSMKFVGLLIAFPIAFLCVFSPQVLTAWVGESYTYLSETVLIMFPIQLAVCAAGVLEVIPILYLKIRSVALFTLSVGAMNILSAAAVLAFTDTGTVGVAIVWTLAMFVLNVLFYPYSIAKMTSSGPGTFLKPMIPGHIALAMCIAAGWLASHFVAMPPTWTAILLVFFLAYAVYIVAALSLGLSREDKNRIRGAMPRSVVKIIPRWML